MGNSRRGFLKTLSGMLLVGAFASIFHVKPVFAAKGTISSLMPPHNDGSKIGAGLINPEDASGNPTGPPWVVFQTPKDCTPPLAVGDVVDYTAGPGNAATGVKKAAPAFEIVSFSAVASGSAGAVTHTLSWITTGALSGKIRYVRNDNGALMDIDISSKVSSGTEIIGTADLASSVGYTLIIFDGPSFSGNSLNANATP